MSSATSRYLAYLHPDLLDLVTHGIGDRNTEEENQVFD